MMSIVEPIQIGQALNRDGVLNLNKPAGWTSHDVVARLRKVLGVRKIGHAGTLDPPATGVLPILVGKGTRVAELLIDWDKEYEAVLRLGQVTETQDGTGTVVLERSTQNLKEETIRSVVAQFQGRLQQIPPMYSAIKIGGTPLYKMARAGRTVERQARWITVQQIEIQSIQGRDVSFRVACSKGTYIRTLCDDIGERLGVGGHLLHLVRTRVGPLHVDQAVSLDDVERESALSGRSFSFLSLDVVLGSFPAVVVDPEAVPRALNGALVPVSALSGEFDGALPDATEGKMFRVKDESGRLLGLGKTSLHARDDCESAGWFSMVKVFVARSTS